MKKWLCIICGWVYDEAKGWPNDGIAPGTKWEDIPDDWLCPDCLVTKADFEMIELDDDDEEENVAITTSIVQPSHEFLEPIVIIGSGHAGYQLAAELRQQSPNISITIFTEDDGALYSKPALSNAFALNKSSEDLVRETALEWERRLNIRLYPHTKVQRIDRENKFIETNIGHHHYGQLVLATGAKPINIDIKGKCTDIVNVNSLMDYSKFRASLSGKNHITILGDGLIGCEFANDLAANGYQVSVVGLGHWAMHRLIPEDLGIALQSALSELGVDWYLKNTIASVSPEDGQYQVTLQNGEVFTTDIILSAIGLKPNTELALTASLDVGIGIKTNLEYRSSDSCIFAIGDCAEVDGQWQPYIQPINQAIPALVKTLLGRPTSVEVTYSPVLVKTPILPLSVLMIGGKGSWEIHAASNDGWSASFLDDQGKLKGFALLGHGLQQQRNDWLIKIQS